MKPTSGAMLPKLSAAQREALISLLADDDPAIYQSVRQKLLAYGHEAADWLRPHLASPDPLLRQRAKSIVIHFARQDADNEFLAFCLRQGDDFDLEEGAWLLARTQYADIQVEGYRALLDYFAQELRSRFRHSTHAAQMLGVMNDFLFVEEQFHGNEEDYYHPDNSYLNRVIDRRMGNPIGLCTVYLLIARRLKMPVAGIGLPGHFICRYQSATEEIYIDPFNGGRLLTKSDCVKYLHTHHHGLYDEFLTPVSPRRMLMRMCSNLHQIYQQNHQSEEAMRLQRYLVALAR
ncbi:transglutaminase-like domain-containing protein [Fontisphaera persica]|jgi:regulator of sirC expression with transglutaminase-like and TPR domain|uniref:SirB1 family protein n=1 Tax=Fontisphaera persica TaxID=2974023 RepID=UPI0024C0627A|nr:transglutaminase-like domain-containing protein [Fontisphaera persica]WCJ60581.1 transglutaminase-like domain-containing protein [Fontisphaera persica]